MYQQKRMVRLFLWISFASTFWPWCIHRSGIWAWVAAGIHWALPLPTGHYPEFLVYLTAHVVPWPFYPVWCCTDKGNARNWVIQGLDRSLRVSYCDILPAHSLRIWKDDFIGIHHLMYRWYFVIADTFKVIQFCSRLSFNVSYYAGHSEQRRWIVSY